jgi:uncharacterized circularly permuted ATP-grasp superfamily protein/uncharacterized alpha-E superfamily protein
MTGSPNTASPPAGGTLRHGYAGLAGARDELLGHGGDVRPHWRTFLHALDDLGPPEFLRRWQEARDLIRENGVTYNVYGDPHGLDRPWQLDPIPVLIPPHEWAGVEAGLTQRARLLELILADVYGPQRLLRDGFLPPELVFDHPGFLRPCHGIRPTTGRSLHFYAADLGRTPDGAFRVLRDKAQAPSGAGYALENRIVLARMLPEAFRECRVQRLALFFRTFRDTLRAIAPRNRDNPRIVLLTPGPYNETYFEHAYLARYLGYTLAEGGDLTVRDNRVYLKLLGGLQPVDVVFRRLGDDFCDPLELRGDSFLGVPGLVQAVRAGNVSVANALGSGLVETPALMAYLPALCRHLLGEDLRLESVPVWWCGDPSALEFVLANLHRLVVKPTFAPARPEPTFGEKLSREQRKTLADRIRAKPRDFVAQEQIPLSTAPVLVGGKLQPRHLVTRAYLCAADDGFMVMPGGLSRVTASPETLVVSMQKGGGSKDTWVLADGAVSEFSLLPTAVRPVELSRGGGDLPSRAADNLYWLGRYVERAEGLVRLMRGILVRLTEKSGLADAPELPALLRALTVQTKEHPGFVGTGGESKRADPEPELLSLIFDAKRPGGLAATLNALYRVAGTARDRISHDMWRVLGGLELRAAAHDWRGATAGGRRTLSDVLDLLNGTVVTLAAFGGLATDSMTRGQGWRFLDMGRRLERAMHTHGLLYGTLTAGGANEGPLLEALLDVADSSMTYRRRYLSSLQTAPVLDLLLADETNPRSLAFQLVALSDGVDNLPHDSPQPARSPEQRLVLGALTAVRLCNIDELARPDATGARPRLEDLLLKLGLDLPVLSDTVTRRFLSHLQPSRHLAALGGEIPLRQ